MGSIMHPIVLAFISFAFISNLFLLFILQLRGYRRRILLPVLVAVVLFGVSSASAVLMFSPTAIVNWPWLPNAVGSTYIWAVASIAAMALMFMRSPTTVIPVVFKKFRVSSLAILVISAAIMGGLSLVMLWAVPVLRNNEILLVIPKWYGVFVPAGAFAFSIWTLYTLETTYRAAGEYQRRIGRIVFVSLGTLAVFHLVFTTRILLFRTVSQGYVFALVAVSGVCLPMVLLGLMRYRLGSEQISISRESIYSSVTFFLAGSILLGLGVVVYIGNRLGVAFHQFEIYLAVFGTAFFLVLTVTSGDFRIRVIRFVNAHLYQQKYDYREQFFRLHRTYMGGDSIHASITDLVENMKYTVAVEDAFVFLRNAEDGNYYIHENAEYATDKDMVIGGESALIAAFDRSTSPLIATKSADVRTGRAMQGEPHIVAKLHIHAVFPIVHDHNLLGILAIRTSKKTVLDGEDAKLIQVFTLSIGSVIFKERILRERIERKQFESFSHVASFIIHDIKNQVSTLSLLSSNADKNIANPQFQQSLLRSLRSCTSNLQNLVDRLAAPPKSQDLVLSSADVNAIVHDVIENTGLTALNDIDFQSRLQATKKASIHAQSFFYVVKNLVTNALEAMDSKGSLTIITGDTSNVPTELTEIFRISESVLSTSRIFLSVSDTGKGMTREFIERRLFHPFNSTKDKGVGIGLYQCRTLIEKMNGKILCHSVPNQGATFCILV